MARCCPGLTGGMLKSANHEGGDETGCPKPSSHPKPKPRATIGMSLSSTGSPHRRSSPQYIYIYISEQLSKRKECPAGTISIAIPSAQQAACTKGLLKVSRHPEDDVFFQKSLICLLLTFFLPTQLPDGWRGKQGNSFCSIFAAANRVAWRPAHLFQLWESYLKNQSDPDCIM